MERSGTGQTSDFLINQLPHSLKKNIHELDASIAGPTSDEEWRESTRWPTLKTSRTSYPKIGSKVIITGGSNGRKLRNKEILDLTSRTLSSGGDMAWPRIHFKLQH